MASQPVEEKDTVVSSLTLPSSSSHAPRSSPPIPAAPPVAASPTLAPPTSSAPPPVSAASARADSEVLKLKGLPYSATEEQIREFFRDFSVTRVAFVYEPDGRPSGLAFAEFATKEDAIQALSKNGEYLGSRYVRLLHVPVFEMEEQVRMGTLAIPGNAAKMRARLLRAQRMTHMACPNYPAGMPPSMGVSNAMPSNGQMMGVGGQYPASVHRGQVYIGDPSWQNPYHQQPQHVRMMQQQPIPVMQQQQQSLSMMQQLQMMPASQLQMMQQQPQQLQMMQQQPQRLQMVQGQQLPVMQRQQVQMMQRQQQQQPPPPPQPQYSAAALSAQFSNLGFGGADTSSQVQSIHNQHLIQLQHQQL